MPTYGYECTGCRDAFEIVQKMSDDALTTCEKCGGELRKKVFPVGIAFKGSGFYVNDYAPKSETPASDAKPVEAVATDTGDGKAAAPATAAPAAPETKAPEAKPAETKAAAPAAPAAKE